MNILVAYGTLSGSTMTVASLIGSVLQGGGHDVTVSSVDTVTKDMLSGYGAIVLGSPSWEDNGMDGQPLPEMTAFLGTLTKEDLAGKHVALFGLGDTSYPHFCGAVDVMTQTLAPFDVTYAVEPLRIDKYYSSPDNEPKAREWATALSKTLTG